MANTVVTSLISVARNFSLQLLKVLVGLSILGVLSLFSDNPLETFFRLLSIVGTILLVLSIIVMLVSFRKAREVSRLSVAFAVVVSLASTVVSLWLSPTGISVLLSAAALTGGAAMGAAWAETMLLYVDDTQVQVRGTIWSLLIWGLTVAFNQLVAIGLGRTPVMGAIATLVAFGIVSGHSLGLLVRIRRVHTRWPSSAQTRL